MTEEQRAWFDALVDEAVGELPEGVLAVLDETPLVVLDEPTPEILRSVGIDPSESGAGASLFGLHSGIAITERSVTHSGELPSQIHIFRRGLVEHVGGWRRLERDASAVDELYEEIRVTLLHEIGHQMGLDEDDLEGLGYD